MIVSQSYNFGFKPDMNYLSATIYLWSDHSEI